METHFIADAQIPVQIKKSERRSTWSLAIRPGGAVQLSVPSKMPLEKIIAILNKHEMWIIKKFAKFSKAPRIELTHGWGEGQSFYFRGRNLTLQFQRSHFPHVVVDDEKLLVHARDFRATVIKKVVEHWLEETTFREAKESIAKWSPRFDIKDEIPLKLRSLKSSWGQCRSDGRITLHRLLGRLHPEFFEYVVVHEMCHLYHMNHSMAFKRLLGEMLPHWKEIKKKHEPLLFG